MKNSLRFYSACLIVILAFALGGCKKPDKKDTNDKPPRVTVRQPRLIESGDSVIIKKERILFRSIQNKHTVVLLVDTENIHPGASDKEIKGYCCFPDLNLGDSIKNYTTDVLSGDSIIWIGKSISSTEHEVRIEMINYHSGNKVYGGPRQGVNGKVRGIISHGLDSADEERYTIKFKVNKGSPPYPMYELDPKLLVH